MTKLRIDASNFCACPHEMSLTREAIESHNPPAIALGTVSNPRGAPDVECAAMLLNDAPITADAFEGRDWVIVNMLLVGIGPPGFSMAPYNSSKPVDKSELKRLYERTEEGDTEVYTFQKVSNNKNKGERVSETKNSEGEMITVKAPLLSGSVVKVFVSKDKVAMNSMGSDGYLVAGATGDASPFLTLDMQEVRTTKLSVGQCVVINVRAKNAEQAAQGNLLNITKMKIVPRNLFRHSVCARMPRSAQEFENLALRIAGFEGLRKCVDMSRATFCTLPLNAEWYVSSKEFAETGNLVICDGLNHTFALPWKLVCEVFNCRAAMESFNGVRKALDMMLARECVQITVRMASLSGVKFNDDEPTVLHLSVDEGRLLELEALRGMKEAIDNVNGVSASVAEEGGVKWLGVELHERRIPKQDDARSMVVCMRLDAEDGDEEWWAEHTGGAVEAAISFVAPPGKSFRMLLCTKKSEQFNMSTDFGGPEAARGADAITVHATVWWQPQSGGGGGARKRVREILSSDED